MQPLKQLSKTFSAVASAEHYLFKMADLQAVIPGQSVAALKALLARAVKAEILQRVCRGVYLYPQADAPRGLVLYHTAARLRAHQFNYLSFESVLSDAGCISQVPMNWITLMSSGRSQVINCGVFGHIEFIHTKRSPQQHIKELTYDPVTHLWRASVKLAVRDMKAAHRNQDLINLNDEQTSH